MCRYVDYSKLLCISNVVVVQVLGIDAFRLIAKLQHFVVSLADGQKLD